MNKPEQWRDVVGYEGYYQVSDLGNVRSVDRIISGPRGVAQLKGKQKESFTPGKYRYFRVWLSKEGKETSKYVHRLVAEAWIGPCPKGKQVCHGPTGRGDNSIGNLSYGTGSQNQLDRRRDGTSGRCVVRSDGKVFPSLTIAAEEASCTVPSIWACCNSRRKTVGGYGWAYYTNK